MLGQVVVVGQILAASTVARPAVLVRFHREAVALADELAFHVAAQVEVAAMGHALQLAELPRGQERKRILDVGRTT